MSFKRLGIFSVAIILGSLLLAAGWVISGSMVSPFEKKAARVALQEIQAVQQLQRTDSAAFQVQVSKANDAISICKKREVTSYDEVIVSLVASELDFAVKKVKLQELPETAAKKATLDSVTKVEASSMQLIREKLQ